MSLSELSPSPLWGHFQALCDRPRPSKHEGLVVEYLKHVAQRNGLVFLQDAVGNVVIKKAASAGFEQSPCIAMQCHIDMVPQKRNDIEHDFYNDPIKPVIDSGWVKATGTTLGADNGIGVAAMLAVLESSDIEHGPLEALFTIDEEAGMSGAKSLDPQIMDAEILFNLDSEDEGELYVGCAGGVDLTINCPVSKVAATQEYLVYEIHVSQLLGGHSGIDIHLGRANANLLLCDFLIRLRTTLDIQVASISGGTLRNAIPRDARATILLASSVVNELNQCMESYNQILHDRYGRIEPNISLTATSSQNVVAQVFDNNTFDCFLDAVIAAPNGVLARNSEQSDIVEVSSNLAIINTKANSIEVQCLLRSADNKDKYHASRQIMAHFDGLNPLVRVDGAYSGWKVNLASPVLAKMSDIYKQHFGQTPDVKVIHAGLECGILGGIYPSWDMISFGPTIKGAHSPDERVEIASVERFWRYLCIALKEVAQQ